jgi:hypothetical protein
MEHGQTSGVAIEGTGERVGAAPDGRLAERGYQADLASDDQAGGQALIPALLAFTIAVIGMDALFDQTMPDQVGVIGLTGAVAAPFLRPFEALMGTDGGFRTACVAVATYAVATILILRALRRAERQPA